MLSLVMEVREKMRDGHNEQLGERFSLGTKFKSHHVWLRCRD